MEKLWSSYERNKQWLFFALIATFLWGMLAHAYGFFDNNISHDSLAEFHAAIAGNNVKLFSGRVLVPLYRDLLRSDVTLPWLIGALSLIWTGLAVFLVLRLFRVESKVIAFLIAGVFTANISVSATVATYIHDLDCNMFSLLCAVTAVYLWRNVKWGVIPGAVLLAASMALYQSFLFTAIALIMMLCIGDLMQENTFRKVFSDGLKSIGMILVGGGLYYIMLQVSQQISGIQLSSGEYNSLDTVLEMTPVMILKLSVEAYQDFFHKLFYADSSYPGILVKAAQLCLLAVSAVAVAAGAWNKKVKAPEKLLMLALAALLPLAMNMIYVMTGSYSHELMIYAIWLFWLQALLLSDWLWKRYRHVRMMDWQRTACLALVAMLLYGNVQFANGMYMKKDIEHDAYLSVMTRIVSRMESCEGYVPGETPVVLLGLPDVVNEVTPGFKDYWGVMGMHSSDPINLQVRTYYQAYFDYIMGTPLLQADEEQRRIADQSGMVEQMQPYPAQNCVALVDGVLIVMLGPIS